MKFISKEYTHNGIKLSSFKLDGVHQPTVTQTTNEKGVVWNMVTRSDKPKFVTGNWTPDAVSIAAICNGRLLVTQEWRETIQDYEWGLPAGLVENGLTIEETAIKELKEETGMDASIKDIQLVSKTLFSSVGMTDECKKVVHLKASGDVSAAYLQDHEDIQAFLMTREEVINLLNQDLKFGAVGYYIMRTFAYTGVTDISKLRGL